MIRCLFLSWLNNAFSSVLVSIFSSMNYFCHKRINSSCVPWIISNLFFGLQYIVALAVEWDWFKCWLPWRPFWKLCKRMSAFKENAKAKHCLGNKYKGGFDRLLQNLRGANSLDEGRIEETTKSSGFKAPYTTLTALLSMTCLLKWAVPYPVLYLESSLVLHVLALGIKTWVRVSPTLNFRKKLLLLIQTGGH